jgi:RNA polymerase sigma-70 factor, ECF subfamily
VEWLDDVKRWKTGDAAATERLREYVTPFVHGALLARMPHHVANALMPEALDLVMASPEQVTKDSVFVLHAVALARRVAKAAKHHPNQERPSLDSTVAEGRQWLERLRALPEELVERVLWRLVEGIPGPEQVEVLGLDEVELRTALERGIGDSLVPPLPLQGAPYLWDLAGEPSTQLARAETWALSLRFDPVRPPEPADVVNTAATFQDLSNAQVGDTTSQANPFRDLKPTVVVLPPEPRSTRLSAAGSGGDEKTEGGFDLPAAARGLVPKTAPATPPAKTGGRQAMAPPVPPHRSAPKVAKVFDDDRPSKKRNVDDERPSRKMSAAPPVPDDREGRRTTVEAPIQPAPSQTRVEDDDERPSRNRPQVRGKLERGEESGRKKSPEHEARRARPVTAEPEGKVAGSGLTPVGAVSEPSLEPTATDSAPRSMPYVTEKLVPRPVSSAARLIAIGVGGALLLVAIVWRLGWFR